MNTFNCPYCPSQGYEVNTVPLQLAINLSTGRVILEKPKLKRCLCISKHVFYVEKEREKEIVEQC
jgi:hypothetical protein